MKVSEIKPGKVQVKGWVQGLKNLGRVKFLQLRDQSGTIQITIKKEKASKKMLEITKSLTKESVVSIKGKAVKNKKAPNGIEIRPEKIEIISKSDSGLPISLQERSSTKLSKRLDWRSLDLRKPKNQAVFRIQSTLTQGVREHLLKEGFLEIFTPCMLGAASESGSDVFPILYFDKEAFLRQDPQLHRQLTIAGGFEKIFEIGPAWRSELSHTTKHLCEHRVCAVEKAFIEDEGDIIKLEEEMVVAALKKVSKECRSELKLLGKKIKIPKTPLPVLEYPEIVKILNKKGIKLKGDLDSEAEKALWEYVQEEFDSEFYFIKKFPSKIKPFYVMMFDSEPEWARSVDLYFRGLELSSGGQREHRYEKIVEQAEERGMKPEGVEWFAKFFKYGVPSHGGFALGIERLTQELLGLKNIRDAVLFSRDPDRLVP